MQEIKKNIEISKGNTEIEKLLKTAETYLSLGRRGDARNIYTTLSKKYPNDSRAWWNLFTLYIKAVEELGVWNLETLNGIFKYEAITPFERAQIAIALSPDLKNEYEKIVHCMIEKLERGDITPIWHSKLGRNGVSEKLRIMIENLPSDDAFRAYILNGQKLAAEFNEIVDSLIPFRSADEFDRIISAMNVIQLKGRGAASSNHEMQFNGSHKELQADIVIGKTLMVIQQRMGYSTEWFSTSLVLLQDWEKSKLCLIDAVKQCKKRRNGCYIATSIYGSYDCPQVWTLRRYRDQTMASTWYGCAFIRIYYLISPTFVKWFGQTEWFKKFWKASLDYIVKRLNYKGFKDTPYEDKR